MAELFHGGRLREAAAQYAIPLEKWLDLSTGVNPDSWPVPPLSIECWQRLPESGDGLEEAAAHYYNTRYSLPVDGSQAAIQILPQLRPSSRVGVLAPSYAEHASAWKRSAHAVVSVAADEVDAHLPNLDVLVLVNPNNPTGERFSIEQLLQWHKTLDSRGGWLVVDEAFMDMTPEQSLAAYSGRSGLIVLRSLGKFFGLAGARVGFVLAWSALLQQLKSRLGPWSVSGPSRTVARMALSDHAWQKKARQQLLAQSQRLNELLQHCGLPSTGGTALFRYCPTVEAEVIHQRLSQQGIFTRLFRQHPALRFGLPGSESDWHRLEQGLDSLMNTQTFKAIEC